MRHDLGTIAHFRKPIGVWSAEHLKSERLRRLFTQRVPAESTTLVLLMVLGYLKHGYLSRPEGGTARFRDALIDTYRRSGGGVILHSTVDEVLVDGDRARGVRLSDGMIVDGDIVIPARCARELWSGDASRARPLVLARRPRGSDRRRRNCERAPQPVTSRRCSLVSLASTWQGNGWNLAAVFRPRSCPGARLRALLPRTKEWVGSRHETVEKKQAACRFEWLSFVLGSCKPYSTPIHTPLPCAPCPP